MQNNKGSRLHGSDHVIEASWVHFEACRYLYVQHDYKGHRIAVKVTNTTLWLDPWGTHLIEMTSPHGDNLLPKAFSPESFNWFKIYTIKTYIFVLIASRRYKTWLNFGLIWSFYKLILKPFLVIVTSLRFLWSEQHHVFQLRTNSPE